MDLVARRKEDVAHRGERRAHEEAQPLSLRAEEGVDGHVVRDLVRAQPEVEPGGERSPGQRDADGPHDHRREAARLDPAVVHHCAQCILAPHQGEFPRNESHSLGQQSGDAHESERSRRSHGRWPPCVWRIV